MAQKRTKRHHYVPKALQKPFRNSKGQIFYSERDQLGNYGEIEPRNLDSAFWVRDYYTILRDEKPADIVEREFYGRIDDYLGSLIPEVLEKFSDGTAVMFSPEALSSLRFVVYHLIKRTPDFMAVLDENDLGLKLVDGMIAGLSEEGDSEGARRYEMLRDQEKHVRKIGRDIRVRAEIAPPSPSIQEALRHYSLRWGVSDGRASFILPSKICYRIGNGGANGLTSRNMELWLPLSPKHVLILLRDPSGAIPFVNYLSSTQIREVNDHAVRHGRAVGAHSDLLLASLLKRKIAS